MAFFYVKSGGSKTSGSEVSELTGAWSGTASEFYDNIVSAINSGGAGNGDEIRVSSDHSHTYSGNTSYLGPAGDNLQMAITSVDNDNRENYLVGAAENTSSGTWTLSGSLGMAGMDVEATAGNFFFTSSTHLIGYQCRLGCSARFQSTYYGNSVELYDCEIAFDGSGAGDDFLWREIAITMEGGSITSAGTKLNNLFINSTFVDGTFVGVDFSALSTTGNLVGSGNTNSVGNMHFQGCKLPGSGVTLASTQPTGPQRKLKFTNTSATSAAAEYQYYMRDFYGEVEDDDAIFRDQSTEFEDSGELVALHINTTSNVKTNTPFHFELPTRFAELSVASTDTLRLYFQSDTTLTDADIWVQVSYPDGTFQHQYNLATTRASDILNGTTHTTDGTSTWSGTSKANQYQMDIDTSGDVGADGVPLITLFVAIDAEIWIDTDIDLVA